MALLDRNFKKKSLLDSIRDQNDEHGNDIIIDNDIVSSVMFCSAVQSLQLYMKHLLLLVLEWQHSGHAIKCVSVTNKVSSNKQTNNKYINK